LKYDESNLIKLHNKYVSKVLFF